MNQKRLTTFALAAIVTGPLILNTPAFAENETHTAKPIMVVDDNFQKVDVSNFIKVSGVISEINRDQELPKLIVEDQKKTTETHFPISNEVLIFNSGTTEQMMRESIKEGQIVDVYYDKYKPILMIYPAVIPPEIVIVHDESKQGQVKVALFDENLVSLDNELKLNIGENTVIMKENGEKLSANDLSGKELIVFYTHSTKSIPAQTTPAKIIVLDTGNEQTLEEVRSIINEDHYIKSDIKMIPIRKVAEHFGFTVKWQEKNLVVQKQNQTLQITIGKEEYSMNKSLKYFKAAPEIMNGKTYVPEELLELLSAK